MPTPLKIHRFGWKPPLPDHRKKLFAAHNVVKATNPGRVDLRGKCPAVYDQGQLGSCTANAGAGLFEFLMMKEGIKPFVPSRLFIYYNERVIEGTVDSDSGAAVADAVKVLSTDGAPPESLWWYNDNGKAFLAKPTKSVYNAALKYKAADYQSVDNTNLDELRTALAQGDPFILGFSVYESFESDAVAASGVVPLPGKNEQQIGGHAVMAVGYDDSKKAFIVRNSWGPNWGIKGYFLFPYAYATNPDLADDFWVVKKVVAA